MITILFAYRNRDLDRIDLAMESLKIQTNSGFNVLFIDYGSEDKYSIPLKKLIGKYSFAKYHYVAHPGLLWNKSKAFNYGIRISQSDYILTADIDLIFHPETIDFLHTLLDLSTFTLFKYGYMPSGLTSERIRNKSFSELEVSHYGEVNGVGLYSKQALEMINGFDEFYHFYGLEDEDLFLRLELAGVKKQRENKDLFRHQWHPRYPAKDDEILTISPRLKNAMRINQQHYFFCKESGNSIPSNQNQWGYIFKKEDLKNLSNPDFSYKIENSAAAVLHFMNEFLPSCKGNIISVTVSENLEGSKVKAKIKKFIGKDQQLYLRMKEVNDIILQKIIFDYRHHNYHFSISEDFKSIYFSIDLS